jgi:hypothetical protein
MVFHVAALWSFWGAGPLEEHPLCYTSWHRLPGEVKSAPSLIPTTTFIQPPLRKLASV